MKVEIDGRVFDSIKEAKRYLHLKAEQAAGRIAALRCQVRFPLRVNGRKVTTYVADFVFVRDGVRIVEDVKGMRTAVYVIKRNLMAAVYGIEIEEV